MFGGKPYYGNKEYKRTRREAVRNKAYLQSLATRPDGESSKTGAKSRTGMQIVPAAR